MSNGQQSTHAELENIWRQHWEAAKLKLELARIRVRETEIDITLSRRAIYEYQMATSAESAAQLDYSRVVRIYMDLVVNGKVPESVDRIYK